MKSVKTKLEIRGKASGNLDLKRKLCKFLHILQRVRHFRIRRDFISFSSKFPSTFSFPSNEDLSVSLWLHNPNHILFPFAP